MEKLLLDSAKDAVQHAQKLMVTIAEIQKAPLMAASKFLTAPLAPKNMSSFTTPASTAKQNTLFVGGGTIKETGKSGTRARVSLMPMTYKEKASHHQELVAQANIAAQSLTGTTSSGGSAMPIAGANVTTCVKNMPPVTELMKDLAFANQVKENPYESGKRLENHLSQGVDAAERKVLQKPDALKEMSPTFKSQVYSKLMS